MRKKRENHTLLRQKKKIEEKSHRLITHIRKKREKSQFHKKKRGKKTNSHEAHGKGGKNHLFMTHKPKKWEKSQTHPYTRKRGKNHTFMTHKQKDKGNHALTLIVMHLLLMKKG